MSKYHIEQSPLRDTVSHRMGVVANPTEFNFEVLRAAREGILATDQRFRLRLFATQAVSGSAIMSSIDMVAL